METLTRVCCVCNKVFENEVWQKREIKKDEKITHGYCLDCFEEAKKELLILKKKQKTA